MRAIQRSLIGVLILIGLAGCANLVQPGVSPLVSPVSNGVILRYQRVGGMGGFDETWTIESSGRVTHTGRGSGTDRQLTPDQMTQLIAALRAAKQADLKDSYIPENTCCDRFTHTLTITLDGLTQTVMTLDAVPDEPPALTNLLATLGDLLR